MFRILTRSSIRNSQRLTLSHHAKVLRWQKRQRGSLILRALPYSEKTVIKALGIFALGAGAAVYNSVDSSNTFISLPPATSARYNQHCQCEAPPNDLENNAPSFNLKDHYELTQVLGEGGFGMVYRALRKSDGVSVALKTLPRADTGKTDFEREVMALQLLSKQPKSLSHSGQDHITKLYDLHRDDIYYYLAMELVEGGELLDHLIEHGAYSEAKAASFLRQFAEAVNFMHGCGLIHADLKPENLLLSSKDPEKAVLKVVDFGSACTHDWSRKDMQQTPYQEFAKGCSFLHMVALGNQFELERLLQETPSLANFRDYDFRTPLHLAASEGHVDICRFLVAKGARINQCDRWGGAPLDDAHRHNHTEVITFLREQGGKFGNTAAAVSRFVEAASAGDEEEVRALLEFGNINIDQGDYDRRTALHLAAGEGRVKIVELLCKAGANVNVEDRWGNRPLNDAKKAGQNSAEIVKLLKEYGGKSANIFHLNNTNQTNQHKTSSSGTIAYWPPEMFAEGAVPTPATDMWAAGVIMYIFLTGSHPLDRYAAKTDAELQELLIKMGSDKGGHMKLLDKVVFDDRVQGLSDSCVDLLRQLMHPNPKKRMTSDNFLRHPWVQGLTASCLAMDQAYGELKTQWQNRFRNKILNKFAVTVEKNENILDKSNLREIFNAIDLEGNGVLDPNELRVVLRSVGEPEDVISKIIASLDLKRDGGRVQGVSWEAFLNVMNIKHEQ